MPQGRKTPDGELTASKERLLDAAEHLFSERGYRSVTLREIATTLGVEQASLYYHVPGGKEALFIEVTERMLHRFREGLESAAQQTDGGIAERLRRIAYWLLEQPPMDLGRMASSDMPSIDPREAERLGHLAYGALFAPVIMVFAEARRNGEIVVPDVSTAAVMFLAMVENLHHVPEQFVIQTKVQMADNLIEMLYKGLQPR